MGLEGPEMVPIQSRKSRLASPWYFIESYYGNCLNETAITCKAITVEQKNSLGYEYEGG